MIPVRPFVLKLQMISIFLSITGLLTGCITAGEKKQMRDDIFNLQTRLLNVETLIADTSKDAKSTGDSATKRIASTQSEIERMAHELQQVHGEIDALRVGVMTGQMPGIDPASQENSVASALGKLGQRLDGLEASQQEILEAIKKAGSTKPVKKKDSAGPLTTSSEVQTAFEDKRYKQVVEEGPKLIQAGGAVTAAKDQELVRYLVAESDYHLGNLRDAALKFNDFVESQPSKTYAAAAKLRLGDCFRRLGDDATSRLYYQELLRDFPKSSEAAKAKEYLAAPSGKK